MNDDIQRRFEDLLLAAGRVFESWLNGLPEDERAEIMALYGDGALPGIRLLLGDERRAPGSRAGDPHAYSWGRHPGRRWA